MGNGGKEAWLLTDEMESGKGPVTVVAVLSPQTGWKKVEEAVDRLWRALHVPGDEQLQYMAPRSWRPYKPQWANNTHCYCGHGGVIVARRVTGLREAPHGQGIDGLTWDGMPDATSPAGLASATQARSLR